MYCSVVIVAGGKGTRMGGEINKQYLKLKDKEVIAHTIEQFEQNEMIDEIIIVTGKEEVQYCTDHIWEKYGFSKIKKIVGGGRERKDSVYNGLLEVSIKTDIVLIHDGARPLVQGEQIQKTIEVAHELGACALGVPVKDTIKICDEDQFVTETPERNKLWIVQTPQTFRYDWIMQAHKEALETNLQVTDDAMLIEKMGYPLKMVMGRYDNIKITTPEDLMWAQMMMK